MLRLEDSRSLTERASEIAKVVGGGNAPLALRCGLSNGRSRLVARLASDLPDVVLVHVPDALDQTERVILEMATALGNDVVFDVDAALREEPEVPARALDRLAAGLGDRPLVVDGWERLGSWAGEAELGLTLRERSRALRSWLGCHGKLFILGRGSAPEHATTKEWRPKDPPIDLVNGTTRSSDLWGRFEQDAGGYELALALLALGAAPDDPALERAEDDGMRARVLELLPQAMRGLLQVLAVHERTLPQNLAVSLHQTKPATVALGASLGLWRDLPAGLLADEGWSRWWRARPRLQYQRPHHELAELFSAQARPRDPTAGRAGLSILEAHRHFLAAGEVEQARTYARYGAALLVEAARESSLSKDYPRAAHLYEYVVAAADEERLPVGVKLRAYARHYLHFNRARARTESFRETERGYRQALKEWPENALFWSRLVRVLFYQDQRQAALKELARAESRVPAHPQRESVLVARTVRGLLRRNRLTEAVLAWRGYRPDTIQAKEVEDLLAVRLGQGWRERDLTVDSGEPLFFTRDGSVRVEKAAATRWVAEAQDLGVAAKGTSPRDALRALVREVRARTKALIRAYTADLSAEERMNKQRLLGAIDVVASRVDAPGPNRVWVFGDLERDDRGQLWLHTGSSYDLWFEVPDEVAGTVTVDDLPHIALVEADRGVPTGPVVSIEAGVHRPAEEIWELWRNRLSDAG